MEFGEVVQRRRMVRRYRDAPVDPAAVERIVTAGLRAPTAGNTGGISVVVVTDPDLRRRISEAAGEAEYRERGFEPWLSTAPVHVVITASPQAYRDRYSEPDKGSSPDRWTVPYWWLDAGAALMAVLLAAVDEGLGAGFLGSHSIPGLGGILGIPGEHLPIGVVTIGLPAPDRRSSSLDRTQPQRVHREVWGG